jgi:hypothetical protein
MSNDDPIYYIRCSGLECPNSKHFASEILPKTESYDSKISSNNYPNISFVLKNVLKCRKDQKICKFFFLTISVIKQR